MAELERVYNIPLRKESRKVPKHKRTPKAIRALKQFMKKHMKSDDLHIGPYLNEYIWQRGIKSPPHHVKVNTIKNKEGKIIVELFGKPMPDLEPKDKKEKKKLEKERAKEAKKSAGKKEEKKKEEPKTPEAKAKSIEKKEIKLARKDLTHKHDRKVAQQPKQKQAIHRQATAPMKK